MEELLSILLIKKIFRLVEMTFGLVHATISDKHFVKFYSLSFPPSLLQSCCSHVTLQSHLNISRFQGFLLWIVTAAYLSSKPSK